GGAVLFPSAAGERQRPVGGGDPWQSARALGALAGGRADHGTGLVGRCGRRPRMIGRSTLLWAALAVTAGMSLFQVSYQVQTLEQELTRTNRQIIGARATIHVLTCAWQYP